MNNKTLQRKPKTTTKLLRINLRLTFCVLLLCLICVYEPKPFPWAIHQAFISSVAQIPPRPIKGWKKPEESHIFASTLSLSAFMEKQTGNYVRRLCPGAHNH